MSEHIVSRPSTDAYRENYDHVFSKTLFIAHTHEWGVTPETCATCKTNRDNALADAIGEQNEYAMRCILRNL